MVNILFLITGLTMGGAETQLYHITKKLKEGKIFEPIVVSLIKADGILVEKIKSEGVPVESLNMEKGKLDLKALWSLNKLLKKYQIDILHSHMFHANFLGRMMKVFKPSLSVISTIHNINIEGRHRELILKYTEFLSNRTTIISEVSKNYFVQKGIIPELKLKVIPNGIDTTNFLDSEDRRERLREEFNLSKNFVWIGIGRFEEQKNYPALLEAFKKVAEKHNHARLILVGMGSLYEDMIRLSKKINIYNYVVFLGLRSDITDLLALSDAYVMSSSWEGLPVVLLEAAASGLPIVATNVGGNSEVVLQEETGYLVEAEDVYALIENMLNLMGLPVDKLKEFGENGKQYIANKYDIDMIIKMWEEVYNSLLKKQKVGL